jgi:mRNA interferase RelE/StbE
MVFELKFELEALSEWKKLDKSVREPLKKKLSKRLENPHVPKDRLFANLAGCYKIKNNKTGHRLIYQVIDSQLVVLVLAVDERSELRAYKSAADRAN